MILRRFAQHIKEQNWVAVFVDILLVGGSVLLAAKISILIEN
jgi:hypothetical protein